MIPQSIKYASYASIALGFLRKLRKKLLLPQRRRKYTCQWVIYAQDNDDVQNRLSLAYADDVDAQDLLILDELLPDAITSQACRPNSMPPTPLSPDNPFTPWFTDQLNKAICKYSTKFAGIYPICWNQSAEPLT